MRARIEKKLSKRLVETAPGIFKDAWTCGEPTDLADEQRTGVSNVYHVGGGVDYWGEGQDAYTAWEWWLMNWYWYGDFPPYPSGHQHEHYPDTGTFRPTTRNLLRLALECGGTVHPLTTN